MSPTDPPLPPSPGEPSDDPSWAAGDEPAPNAGSGERATGDAATGDEATEEVAAPIEPIEEAPGADAAEPTEPVEEAPAAVVPPADEPTALMPADEPTDVMAAAPTAVLSGTDSSPSAEMRRRVSHRRYVARRIVVALCALLILAGIVGLIAWAFGRDGGGALGTGDTTEPAVVTDPATTEPTTSAAVVVTKPELTVPADSTEPEDSEPAESSGTDGTGPAAGTTEPMETTEPTEDPAATSVPETSEPEEPTYSLGLRAECQIDDVVQLGDTGPNVECLEQRLDQITFGGVQFEVDDVFDEDTDAAVRELQEANDLVVDGIVGSQTAQLLSIWNPSTD